MSIIEFLESWSLFGKPYALTLLASAVLAIVGVVTAARRQVFMAAAVAQASTFGYALFALLAGATATQLGGDIGRDAVVIASAVAAALVTMLQPTRDTQGGRLDGDERTAAVFIAAGAGAILVLANAPAGMEQFRRMQTSSVIGATMMDVLLFASVLLALAVLIACFSRPLILMLADPVMASAVGLRVALWNVVIAVIAGLCVGLAVRSTGMLFAFGCLALPVMIAKQFCGEVRSLFWVSPLLASAFALVGLWLSYAADLPPGQVVVALLCVVLVIASTARFAWDQMAR